MTPEEEEAYIFAITIGVVEGMFLVGTCAGMLEDELFHFAKNYLVKKTADWKTSQRIALRNFFFEVAKEGEHLSFEAGELTGEEMENARRINRQMADLYDKMGCV